MNANDSGILCKRLTLLGFLVNVNVKVFIKEWGKGEFIRAQEK